MSRPKARISNSLATPCPTMGKGQSGTLGGEKQASKTGPLKCGDVGTYRELKKRKTNRQERDHVPATQSMLAAGQSHKAALNYAQKECFDRYVKMDAVTIAIPRRIHKEHSRTQGGKGGASRVAKDAGNLIDAAEADFAELKPYLRDCKDKYETAKAEVLAQLPDKLFKECKKKALENC